MDPLIALELGLTRHHELMREAEADRRARAVKARPSTSRKPLRRLIAGRRPH